MRTLLSILIATTACVKSGQVVERPLPHKSIDLRHLCTSEFRDLCTPIQQEAPLKIDTNLTMPAHGHAFG
jgi:hypothetical protein